MQVREIMSERVACCVPQTSLQDAARMMEENDCGSIPVIENEQDRELVGVITDRDIACRTVARGKNPLEMTVGDCMSTPAVAVTSNADLEECCRKMEEHQVRRMPVVDEGGGCCGVVAQADIAGKASERETAEVVKEISRPAAQPDHG